MKKLLLCVAMIVFLGARLFSAVIPPSDELDSLDLQPGSWLVVTKAVEGPSNYDLDFLVAVVASSALTDGKPSVLAVTDSTCLTSEAWHADYVNRYHPEKALVIGQTISSISGVSELITLNSVSAGVEQAKAVATTVWSRSDRVVVCSRDDDDNALVAASLAANLRVPLLFTASSGDLDGVLGQLEVQSALVVGAPLTLQVPSTTLSGAVAVVTWLRNNGYSVDYLSAVNSADREVNPDGSKLSLIATLLAARRGGMVVPIQNAATYVTAGDELQQFYSEIGTNYYPEYLVIVATPTFIPFGEVAGLSTVPEWSVLMTDATYADIDADPFLEIATGRVVANNFSEGSLVASRISTYDALKNGDWENRFAEMGRWGISEAVPVLENCGFSRDDLMGAVHNDSPPIEDGLILHYDHSWWYGLGEAFNVDNLNTLLAPAFILTKGCSTAALDKDSKQISKNLLRQGAVGFMGGPRNLQGMAGHMGSEVINAIVSGESLGHAYRRAFEAVSLNVLDADDHGSNVTRYNWILIGDPALVLHVPNLPVEQPAHQEITSNGTDLTVAGPETWWVRPYPDPLLVEWGWYPQTLHAVIGAGSALMSYWGAPGYDHQIPYFVAKYRTAGRIQNITQEVGIPTPLGWGGSFANHVHVDEHADGTRTYLWRVQLMDYHHENGGSIINTVDSFQYTLNRSKSGLTVVNGTGTGAYDPGSQVEITADPATVGMVFSGWSGDTSLIADVMASTTTVTVGDGDFHVEALFSPLTIPPVHFVGHYTRRPVLNNWHEVDITLDGSELWWNNAAGVSWSLALISNDLLRTGADCPYGVKDCTIESEDDGNGGLRITGIYFQNELYSALSGYDAWAVAVGAGAPDADDDGDGWSNFLEYALDGNPGTGGDVKPTFVKAGDGFEYCYKRRNDDPDLVYLLETTPDLVSGTWTSAVYTILGTNLIGGAYDEVVNEVPANDPSVFIRLKVTEQ